jgi:hypothetical protein
MEFYNWKPISAVSAQRALDRGGKIRKLPYSFGNGQAVFEHALQTARGTCHLVSNRTLQSLDIPKTAWVK